MSRLHPWILPSGFALFAAACSAQTMPVVAPPSQPSIPVAVAPPVSSSAAVLTGQWDPIARTFVLQSRLAADGSPDPLGRRILLEAAGRELGEYSYDATRQQLALVTGTAPFCTRQSGGSACWTASEALHLVDLDTGESRPVTLTGFGRVAAIRHSPDGAQVALVHQSHTGVELRVFDADRGDLLASTPLRFVAVRLEYSLDGAEIAVLGADPGDDPGITRPGPLTIAVFGTQRLDPIWDRALHGVVHGSWCVATCDGFEGPMLFAYWAPAHLRLPGSDRLVVVHADSDRMTSIDFRERRLETFKIASPRTWLDRLMALGAVPAEAKGGSQGAYRSAVASDDGSRVYAVGARFLASRTDEGHWDSWDEPTGLIVFDPASGALLGSKTTSAGRVGLSHDGRWVLLTVWESSDPTLETVEVSTLEPGPTLDAWDFIAGRGTDGTPLLMGTAYTPVGQIYAMLSSESLEVIRTWANLDRVFLLP